LAAVPAVGRADRIPAEPAAAAASDLFERYRARIYAYCLHQLSSREEAEDATQTTFMNAFRGLERGVLPESEQAWLFKIAENVCLSRRRTSWRRGRIESPSDFEQIEDVVPAPPRDLAEELIGLQDALEAMPENQRRAILLREWQGLSYREIAGELELSQAAVETLIFRARRTLATGLEEPAPAKRRRRALVGGGINLGSLLTALKELLAGSAATKAVAVAVAATSTTIAASSLPDRPAERESRAAKPTQVQPLEQAGAPAAAVAGQDVAPRRVERASAPAKPKPQPKATPGASTPRTVVPVAVEPEPVAPVVEATAAPAPVEVPAVAPVDARPPEPKAAKPTPPEPKAEKPVPPARELQSETPEKGRPAEAGPPEDKGQPAERGKENKPPEAGPPVEKAPENAGNAHEPHGQPDDATRGHDKEKDKEKDKSK
jgi:RNA polymerase sigma factor (sigma-70 family)